LITSLAPRSCGDEVLLLLRTSQHNHNKWGLPGGNVEMGDADALATATREATEELTHLPAFTAQRPVRVEGEGLGVMG